MTLNLVMTADARYFCCSCLTDIVGLSTRASAVEFRIYRLSSRGMNTNKTVIASRSCWLLGL